MVATTNTLNTSISYRLKNLVNFLTQINTGFSEVAEEVDSPNLKNALKAVSLDSNQFAKELTCELHLNNLDLDTQEPTDDIWKSILSRVNKDSKLCKGGEIDSLCNNSENYFIQIYQSLLMENIPLNNIKDIITYQLNAIKCAFLRIRLLNKIRFT